MAPTDLDRGPSTAPETATPSAAVEAHTEQQGDPARLVRLATMTSALGDEAGHTDLDHHGRQRLTDMYQRSICALHTALPDELARELDELLTPMPTATPTNAELGVLQAQLNGWLVGLLQGLHASAWAQHVAAQQQLQDLRHARELERERRPLPGGPYL